MAGMFQTTRAQRRELERQNLKWPLLPVEIPRDQWPKYETDKVLLKVWRSRSYLIQVFDEDAPALARLSVSRTSVEEKTGRWKEDITWDDLQWIKSVVGYHDHDAVEIYPPTTDVVNVANMRHLWVLRDPLAFAWRHPRLKREPVEVKAGEA
jgi:hypothetical protein